MTTPTINQIRDILRSCDYGDGLHWYHEEDCLHFDDQVLYPQAIHEAWDRITPDDNEGQITDPATQIVFGAVMGNLPELWVDRLGDIDDSDY